MRFKPDSKNSDSNNAGVIIDATGKSLKHPVLRRDRWRHASSKMKVTAVSIVAFVALLATFLTNIEKITHFIKARTLPSVPPIIVKLSNSSNEDVIVSGRGDFTLWLPGPDAYHTMGKYEFLTVEGNLPAEGSLTIPSKETVTVLARIMNETLFSKILSQGDCDLSLLVYRAGAGLTHTNNMPFTKVAIKKYYIETDVGKR